MNLIHERQAERSLHARANRAGALPRHLMGYVFCALAIGLAACVAGCGGGKQYLRAQAFASPDVSVTPQEIWVGGKKLWVRVDVQNNSKSPIAVNRDAITAHTATGQTVPRAIGAYTTHEPYVILPGSFHPVYVEFEEQGFAWRDVGSAQVDFNNSILRDGQPVPVPMLVVSR